MLLNVPTYDIHAGSCYSCRVHSINSSNAVNILCKMTCFPTLAEFNPPPPYFVELPLSKKNSAKLKLCWNEYQHIICAQERGCVHLVLTFKWNSLQLIDSARSTRKPLFDSTPLNASSIDSINFGVLLDVFTSTLPVSTRLVLRDVLDERRHEASIW